jgi:hypothetical protein
VGMYEKYVKPQSVELDIMLPNCIIVDIDGTIATGGDITKAPNGNIPLEWDKYFEDCLSYKPIQEIIILIILKTITSKKNNYITNITFLFYYL